MIRGAWASGRRLLLMGSSKYKAEVLPADVIELIDEAVTRDMTIIVGEARGACRSYQDYLNSIGYRDVIVGHARSIRYNAGGWNTVKYGDALKERERGMIEDCDSAIVIWVDSSGQIAKNLELLKRLDKPTYLYEYDTESKEEKSGFLDPTRAYVRYRRIRARTRIDDDRLNEIIDSFLTSSDGERLVESEHPSLTGYHLNKLILEKGLEEKLGIRVESGSCYLSRRAGL